MKLLACSIACLLVAVAVGCASHEETVSPTAAPFGGDVAIPAGSAVTCQGDGRLDLTPLLAELGVDYVELRHGVQTLGADAGPPVAQTAAAAGAACKGAPSSDCQTRLDAVVPAQPATLSLRDYANSVFRGTALVTTKGATVAVYPDISALVAGFGGTVRTRAEAEIILFFRGYGLDCDDIRRAAVWPASDGFDVIALDQTCEVDHRLLLHIDGAGKIRIDRTETTRNDPGTDC